jgi:hypothetical protein
MTFGRYIMHDACIRSFTVAELSGRDLCFGALISSSCVRLPFSYLLMYSTFEKLVCSLRYTVLKFVMLWGKNAKNAG